MIVLELYLKTIIYILYLLVFLTTYSFFVVLKKNKKPFLLKVSKKTTSILLVILVLGIILRIFVVSPTHLLYEDEFHHLEEAKNLNNMGEPLLSPTHNAEVKSWGYNHSKIPGWSFLLSLAFLLFGQSSLVAFLFANILSILSLGAVFYATLLVFKDEKAGLWAAFLLSVSPLHVIWSNSIESTTPSLFFVLISLIAFLQWLHNQRVEFFLLAFLLTLLCISIRLENSLLIVAFMLFWVKEKGFKRKKINQLVDKFFISILAGVVALLTSTLFLITHLGIYSHTLFLNNYAVNFFPFLSSVTLDFFYLVILVGLYYVSKIRHAKVYMPLTLLLLYSVISLPFFSETRFAIIPGVCLMMVLSIYLSQGMEQIKWKKILMVGMVLMSLILFANGILESNKTFSFEQMQMRAMTEFKDHITPSCLLVVESPLVYSLRNVNTVSSSNFLEKGSYVKSPCVFFLKDMYCQEKTFPPFGMREKSCSKIENEFDAKEEKSIESKKHKITLFRLVNVSNSVPRG